MKALILLSLLFGLDTAQAAAPISCEMAMLKVATDNYYENWPTFVKMISIEEISFDYVAEGQSAVVFKGESAAIAGQECALRVEMTYVYDPLAGGCPEYKFSEIKTSCE